MAPRKTRSLPAKSSQDGTTEQDTPQLPPKDEQIFKTFVIPESVSEDARIVSLANPSNGQLSGYLYCPHTGFYEFTQVSNLGSNSQSCLMVNQHKDADLEHGQPLDEGMASELGHGYVMENAQLLVATPFDPKLLLMSLFKPGMLNERSRPHMARMADDLLDDLAKTSRHLKGLLRYLSVRKLFVEQLENVCECVEALGETAYRPDSLAMLSVLVQKARSVVAKAWPASLESYVQKRLEVPVAVALMRGDRTVNTDSQDHSDTITSSIEKDLPKGPEVGASADSTSSKPSNAVVEQMRLRVALDFVFASYVPTKLKEYFEDVISSPNTRMIDFTELDAHLQSVEQLKKEARALQSISDNVSRKRAAEEDDEQQEARNEKRRKKEEEEKKRKQETRALKVLKKVDTSGMKKLSSFFGKRAG